MRKLVSHVCLGCWYLPLIRQYLFRPTTPSLPSLPSCQRCLSAAADWWPSAGYPGQPGQCSSYWFGCRNPNLQTNAAGGQEPPEAAHNQVQAVAKPELRALLNQDYGTYTQSVLAWWERNWSTHSSGSEVFPSGWPSHCHPYIKESVYKRPNQLTMAVNPWSHYNHKLILWNRLSKSKLVSRSNFYR